MADSFNPTDKFQSNRNLKIGLDSILSNSVMSLLNFVKLYFKIVHISKTSNYLSTPTKNLIDKKIYSKFLSNY